MKEAQHLIRKLTENGNIADEELEYLINFDGELPFLTKAADETRRKHYGTEVYIRGLIEISNYCKNNCFYCGIRRDNTKAARYRLDKHEILECCRIGYALGFRTFVMQGGEDAYYTDARMCDIVSAVKQAYPDCAITLSLGERSAESYKAMYDAGADRYLLRHETADAAHYGMLHPSEMSIENRKKCLYELKKIGYRVGAGFMVGAPYQTTQNIIDDFRFLQKLEPDMIGVGPYITHADTPFAGFKSGMADRTVRIISLIRLMLPYALIPATTALGTIHPTGRELGLTAGANVVMPNLSPIGVRKLYNLYENKIYTDKEAAEGLEELKKSVEKIGYEIVTSVGDVRR